jgi:hypothetical protein
LAGCELPTAPMLTVASLAASAITARKYRGQAW